MVWLIKDRAKFTEEYEKSWKKLNDSYNNSHPILDIAFVNPLIKYFSNNATVLAVDKDGDETKGIALLDKHSLGRWQAFSPSQSPLGIILIPDQLNQANLPLNALLKSLPGFAWMLGILNQDPDYPGFTCRKDNAAEVLEYATTINVKVTDEFDNYWSKRDRKLRENIKRGFKKLEKTFSKYELIKINASSDIKQAVQVYGDMESMGWKGKNGTAIHADNVQGKFYREMLENFSENDDARIYQMTLDGKVSASQIAIKRNRTMILLKTTYDESLSKLGVGRLMQYLILQSVFQENEVDTIEFYTKSTSQDRHWATNSRNMYHINYYRNHMFISAITRLRKLRNLKKAQDTTAT